jgi:hypothetical protein
LVTLERDAGHCETSERRQSIHWRRLHPSALSTFMKQVFVPVALSLLLFTVTGCGSSSGPRRLSIQLSPSAPTLAVNSSVAIDAETTPGLPKYFGSLTWSIQGYGFKCTEVVSDPKTAPPMPNCPNGWLAYTQPMTGYTPTEASYYAPAAAGSYTVVVEGQINNQSSFQKLDYQGNASAVVTVTTP